MIKEGSSLSCGMLILGLIAAIFTLDLMTPRGYSVWVLYPFPLLLTLRRDSPFSPMFVLFLCVSMMLIAVPVKRVDITPMLVSILNRFGALASGVVFALLIVREKREKEKLCRSEQTLHCAFSAAPIGMGIMAPKRIFTWVNRAMSGITGYREDELAGRNARILYFTEDEYDRVGREKYSRIARGMPGVIETVLRRKDGSPADVVLSTAAINENDLSQGYVVTMMDISQRKRLERELFRDRNTFYTLAESSPDVIFIYDLEMRFRYINRSIKRITGFEAEHFFGKTVEEVGTPGYLCRQWREEFKKVLETKQKRTFEFTFPSPGGERHFIETDIPVIGKGGVVEVVEGFAHDITALKAFQKTLEKRVSERSEALVASQRKLEQNKRLSDIGLLAATVAHELRNPLGGIKMAAYNIKHKVGEDRISGQLSSIDKKISQSDEIINNLLFFARLRNPRPEPVDIRGLLEEDIKAFRCRFHDFTVVDDLRGIEGLRVPVDPAQMRELFNNLIGNARDAVAENAGHLIVRGKREDSALKLKFEDDGPGFSPDELKKAFEPFFTRKTRGMGLGLTVARQIVRLHNGTIAVESEKGKGTKVTVILPLAQTQS